MNKGYIYLQRSIEDNPIVTKDNDYFRVWVHLLLNASHTDHPMIFDGEKRIIKRGEVLTSRKRLAEKCNVNEYKIERIIKWLKSEQQIAQQTDTKSRVISILNYDKYQKPHNKMHNNRTTTAQQPHTYNKLKEIKINEEGRDDLSQPGQAPENPVTDIWMLIHKRYNLDEWAWESYRKVIDGAIRRLGRDKLTQAIRDFLKDKEPGSDCRTLDKFMRWGVDEYVSARVEKQENVTTTKIYCPTCDAVREVERAVANVQFCTDDQDQMLSFNDYRQEKVHRQNNDPKWIQKQIDKSLYEQS